jgi:hypothetical protein
VIKAEYARVLTVRRDDLIAVGVNAALVTICWFLLPDGARNWLFALQGALAFAYVLEMWMLGDTPATNILGRDRDRALVLLRDPAAMRQWLRAKHIALWTFVGPPCAVVALVIGIARGEFMAGLAVALLLLTLPLGVLSVAAWVGIWLPYHPQSLAWRWRHRTDRRGAVTSAAGGTNWPLARHGGFHRSELDRLCARTSGYLKARPPPARQAQRIPG